ncbi:similar to Saccharomyces cerevisiae YDL044C MTF2 Mitochondrial matrix protein [Maudiozyma barnettii]|uniref:Similar to Saccharomyces cerevisiae YDL044C MTF2 Mitochondrial matrix protein n=1 Tax=Maudiozyma barnettii TaxID=61262 RepID=A0A8H2ZGY9_9SACH|nr:Mtf2p [Kazachstania barnettii]CAB4253205.1 similar to Saccharomyces cerevisiae YDL044C MTF2 Mitochondrial matrix protein [Kazachstania barnettii]CAD1780259.1 similar to Saccharomyces cerevisiae YDL044C MTF2 Mitochondrial matrix protein [Kazachstania barnettii]
MLRYSSSKILQLGTRNTARLLHTNVQILQQIKLETNTPLLDSTTENLKEDEVEASVKERMIFGSIFERMQRKEELRNQRMSELLDTEGDKKGKDIGEVKVNFGQNEQYEDIDPEDINLVEYFKQESEKNKENDDLFSKVDRNKKGGTGKSSIIYDLFENIEKSILQNKKRTLEQADAMKIVNFSPSSLPTPNVIQSQSLGIDVKKLEDEERYKAAMDSAMKPYTDQLKLSISSDYDVLEKIKEMIKLFTARDKSLDSLNNNQPVDIINTIKGYSEKNSEVIPEPYVITIPYCMLRLLIGPEFNMSSERKYNIATYVYHECKTCQDLSLYLNMCNVIFYNQLLRLSWENFKDIKRILDLTTEMKINGILGDIETVELLGTLIRDIDATYDDYLPVENNIEENSGTAKGILWTHQTRIYLNEVRKYLKQLKLALTAEQS